MRTFILAGALAAAVAAPAQADLLWNLDGVSPSGTGRWDWTYSLQLTSTIEQIRPLSAFTPPVVADFAALVDFPGYVPASAAWTSLGGFTGALVVENETAGAFFDPPQDDDPALPNFRVNNAGSTTYRAATAPQTLGTLRLTSTAGGVPANNTDIYSRVLVEQGDSSSEIALIGTVAGPIPEPGTYAMLIAGLAGLGFAVRRRAAR